MTGDIETGARPTGDMDPEAYRQAARRVADWTADYLRDVERFPVLSPAAAGIGARRAAGVAATALGEPLDAVLSDIDELLIPATTHWQSPGFMAYFASSGSAPGILGETLAAAFNVNAMLWRTAPAATELEQVTLDWLRQMVGLPEPLFGVINDTASSSTLYALAAAREAQARSAHPRARHGRAPRAATPALLRVGRGALVRREGRHRARHRQRRAAPHPGRRTFSHGPGRPAPGDSRGCRGRDPPIRGRGHGGNHLDDQRRPDRRRSPRCASSTGSGCMSTRRMAARQRSRPSCAGCSTAPSVPTRSWSTRTSGSSRRSTAACSGRGGPRCCATRSRSCPSTSPPPTGPMRTRPNLMDYGTSLGRRMRALKLWMVIRHFGTDGLAQRIREHCEYAVDARALGRRASATSSCSHPRR